MAFHARGELGRKRFLLDAGGELVQRGEEFLARQLLLALVVVGARLHRAHRDDLVAGAGEEQDLRAVGTLLEPLQPVEAVAASEHVIEDHRLVGAERKIGGREVAFQRVELVDGPGRPVLLDVMRKQATQRDAVMIPLEVVTTQRPSCLWIDSIRPRIGTTSPASTSISPIRGPWINAIPR